MKSPAYVCIHPHLTEWFVVKCGILGTILNEQNLITPLHCNCNINCFLNNNSGDPVIALLNNFAVLSKDEIRSFTLLKFSLNYFEKINPKDSCL